MPGVLLVAKDVGLAAPLAMVAAELAKLGVGSAAFLRGGPDIFCLNELFFHIARTNYPDFVLTGMSSSPELSECELKTLQFAYDNKVPFGVFSDTFGAWKGREWFEEYRQEAAALFVLNEEEAEEARVRYPQAKVFGYGNPRWVEFFTQRTTRDRVRRTLDLDWDDVVVEVPGGKDLQVNLAHFGAVINAVVLLQKNTSRRFFVVISIHPGDDPKNEHGHKAEYEKLADGKSFVLITDKSLISADDMLVGANMVVQSASTVGVTASCQRIPVINFFTQAALDRLEKNVGSRLWEPVEQGVELQVVDDVEALSRLMFSFYMGNGSEVRALLARQAEVYPKPTGKPAAALIAEALRDLIGKK